jgi:LuxR family maltose regulon positive regulatory protein
MHSTSHMQHGRFIQSKLRPPNTGLELTPRSEFCQRVLESRANFVLVSAPAGYGKSTAMTLLAKRMVEEGIKVGWLTVDAADNDIASFANYLWRSLVALLPEHVRLSDDSSAVEVASEVLTGRSYELLEALSLFEQPLALFIDDFERISSPEVFAFVTSLVSNLTEGQRLIIGSRQKTQLPLGRLRVQGRLLEMQVQDLRFSQEETRTYLNSRLKKDLGESNLSLIQERTDGWAVALQLSTAALMNGASSAVVLKGLPGPNQEIADYLAEDVLTRLPSDQREFLIRSSLFEAFCPVMCDEVFERTDSGTIIEQIEKGNLFLQTIDADQVWYRYHPLFRDFLKNQLARSGLIAEVTQWHIRSARWLDRAGQGLQAVNHAIEAGNFEYAAEIMVERSSEFLRDGQFRLVHEWIKLLPDEVVGKQPQLLIAATYAMVFLHQYKSAWALLARLEGMGLVPGPFACDLAALRVMIGGWSDDPAAMETAITVLPSFQGALPYYVGLLRNTAAIQEIARGNYHAALQQLAAAKHDLQSVQSIYGFSYSQCLEGAIEMLEGSVIQAEARFNSTLCGLIETGDRFTNSTAVAAAFLIEARYELNDLDSVDILLTNYLSMIRDYCLPDQLITTYRVAARVHFIRGRQSEALETLDALQDLGDLRGVPRLAAGARQGKLRLALRAGDIAAANRLYLLLAEPDIWEKWKGMFPYSDDLDDPLIAKVRIGLVSGTGAALISDLQEAILEAEEKNRFRRLVRLRCLLAQALDAARKRPQAVEILEKTLVFAEPKGLFRVIADDAWLLMPLLEVLELRSKRISRNFIMALIKATVDTNVAFIPGNITDMGNEQAPKTNLSQRELQIIRLLGDGASNKELSRKLIMSENTVETHLRRIYSKLSAKNRTHAVAKARECGLL